MLLIIAYGNSLRRDDGAGLRLGEMIADICRKRRLGVKHIAAHQLTPELALDVAEDEVSAVIFTDARVVSEDDERHVPDIRVRPLPSESGGPRLGHHLRPPTVMAYARLLYAKSPPAWIATVPGVDFNHGEGLSAVAETALASLPDALDALVIAPVLSRRQAETVISAVNISDWANPLTSA